MGTLKTPLKFILGKDIDFNLQNLFIKIIKSLIIFIWTIINYVYKEMYSCYFKFCEMAPLW